jgi:hypothetical protein
VGRLWYDFIPLMTLCGGELIVITLPVSGLDRVVRVEVRGEDRDLWRNV